MPKATECVLNGNIVGVAEALTLRDEAKARGTARPDFRCIDCLKSVWPHRDSGTGAAHFEHMERNPSCPRSDPARN